MILDFDDLSFDQVIEAIYSTPNLVLVRRLLDEARRFSTEEQKEIRIAHDISFSEFVKGKDKFRVCFGDLILYWFKSTPFFYCDYTVMIDPNEIDWDDNVEYIDATFPTATDMQLESRRLALFRED